MPFLTEPEPPRGVPTDVLPGIRRLVARNPSVMTYHGTNTYLIDDPGGLIVLDPGPNDATHVADIIRAAAAPIMKIVLTHTHGDHCGAAPALRDATGAPIYGHALGRTDKFKPDVTLADGERAAALIALATPGHAADHLCFEFTTGAGKLLFSGDHVMSWSSSIVSPPDGDMLDYYRSLELLLRRDDTMYLPGHGPLLPEPRLLTAELLAHRQRREEAIMQRLRRGPAEVAEISEELYLKTNTWLKMAARHNVLAHLLKLRDEHIVVELPPGELSATTMPPLDNATQKMVETEGGAAARTNMEKLSLRRFVLVPAAEKSF